jgi:hypothetical protein
MMIDITRTAPELCHACGYATNAAAEVDGRAGTPDPGDWSLCLNCGEVSVFGLDLKRRRLTEAELRDMSDDDRDTMRYAKANCLRARGIDLTKHGGHV